MAETRENAEFYNDQAIACLKAGRNGEALALFHKAVTGWPAAQKPRRNFARVLFAMDREREAFDLICTTPERVREAESWLQLAAMYADIGQAQAADKARKAGEAVRLKAAGDDYLACGQIPEAEDAYRQGHALWPEDAGLCRRRVEIAPGQADAALRAEITTLLAQPDLTDPDAADLHIALFQVLDAAGDYAAAFAHLEAANAAKRRRMRYHEAGALHALSAMQTAFPAEVFKNAAGATHVGPRHVSPRHVFVVGMPRSGSTLVEHMLAGHTEVFAAGEQTVFPQLVHALCPPDPASWPALPPERLTELGDRYRAALAPLSRDARLIVDKLPANAVYAGLIALALPEAKIVWVERDALDCAFSCYRQIFSDDLPWLYDQGELGRYARALTALLRHWQETLPAQQFLHLSYEDLLAAPEATLRALFAFCGVEWQEGCLHFEKNARAVHTASALAVRQPLRKDTGGRWKPYASGLKRLVAALDGREGCTDENTGPGQTGDRQQCPGAD